MGVTEQWSGPRSLAARVARLAAVAAVAVVWPQARAEVPFNTPIQLVRPTPNHTSMLPVMEGLLQIAQHHGGSIAIVSVVGPYHSGKSFLLNALLGNTQVFAVGRKTSPETMGIWICRTELRARDGSEVWLLDSEGFFGPGVSESYDAKVFTIASLLGAHLVYNTVKIIDQQAVNLLEMLARRAQLFRTKSAAEKTSIETPEFLSVRSFPPLTWVVEDFVQELPEDYRHEGGATTWLKSYLSRVNGTAESGAEDPHFLSRLYSDLTVHTLFLPATSREHLQDLSTLNFDGLTPEFKEELRTLREHILFKLEARKFEGSAMTGPTLERSLRFIVQALQRGMFHELPSLWSTWSMQVAEMSLQDAETWFSSLISSVDTGEDPMPVAQFNMRVEEARGRALQFYRDLLHDFNIRPAEAELQNRMAVHFKHKLVHYHERINRWVGDLIQVEKDGFEHYLASLELPMDPDTLVKSGDNTSTAATQRFQERLQAFSSRGPPAKSSLHAKMPVFSQDPVERLRKDLRAMQGLRQHDNGNEIQLYFQSAVRAADVAVAEEVEQYSKQLPFGESTMQTLRKAVAARCWEAFNEQLSRHSWMRVLSYYKNNVALVQTDTLDMRIKDLAAVNKQKLKEHFRVVLDRCTDSYRARKETLGKTRNEGFQDPLTETELEKEHLQLANDIRNILDEQARNLLDTEEYKSVARSLNLMLEEGYQHARQKNVELWKAHSDEATRCALRENKAVEQRCGWSCMFNKVPHVHKRTSQQHLIECFKRSGAGSRMAESMQRQVFENWYNKDLANDANTVANHFKLGSGLVGGLAILVFWVYRVRQQAPQTHFQMPAASGVYGGPYTRSPGLNHMPTRVPGSAWGGPWSQPYQ